MKIKDFLKLALPGAEQIAICELDDYEESERRVIDSADNFLRLNKYKNEINHEIDSWNYGSDKEGIILEINYVK